MISVELGKPSLCWEVFSLEFNHQSLLASLDLICELRDKAWICAEASKRRATKIWFKGIDKKFPRRRFGMEDKKWN